MKQIIKKQLLFLIGIMFCGVMTAQAQRFGDDILLHECDKAYSIKTKISVADNGWIYVLMSKYGHPTERDEFKIYRSIDGGKNFEAIFSGQFLEDFRQVGMDLVVTGNDPSNITIWFVHACNNTETGEAYVYLYAINADASDLDEKYKYTYSDAIANDVAISTNARSPEEAWTPFALGVAVSYNTKTGIIAGQIDYIYSLDGGANFTRKSMCGMEGSKFGNVDISIGQATAEVYYPRAGIVFEMDNKKNIGFVAAMADGSKTTDFLKVNKKYSETDDVSNPKIQWLCNNTIDAPYNFMIAYSDLYNGNDWDIIKIYPLSGYNLDNHTLDNLGWEYMAAYGGINEDYADLSYDKESNNYLFVYEENYDNAEYKLVYKVQNYTDIAEGESNWTRIGDVSSAGGGYYYFTYPVVDVDPTQNKACFAFPFYDTNLNTTKLLFDSQWSTVGIENYEIVAKDMNVYPNPASNLINVISENANELITISDLSGKVVYSELASEKQNSIDISNLSAGMYIVRIGEKATKFVKE